MDMMLDENDRLLQEDSEINLQGHVSDRSSARCQRGRRNPFFKALAEHTENGLRVGLRANLAAVAVACLVLLFCSISGRAQTEGRTSLPADVQQTIHDYILAHPEVLMESLQRAKKKEDDRIAASRKSTVKSFRKELTADSRTPIFGNPNGDVTLVEFFDYRCPYCRRMEPLLQNLIRDDPGVRVVQKEWPILGPASVYAARVALAALKQGKHPQLHEALMAKKPNMNEAVILKAAEEVGLDIDQIKVDMNSPEVDNEIQRGIQIAKLLGLNGTPAFIVGDELLPGWTDLATLKSMVDGARHGTN